MKDTTPEPTQDTVPEPAGETNLADVLGELDPTFKTEQEAPEVREETPVKEVVEGTSLDVDEDLDTTDIISDAEREARELESDEFGIPKSEEEADDADVEENFTPEDYLDKEKIPEIRKENRQKAKVIKEKDTRIVELETTLIEREARIKEVEEKLDTVEQEATSKADFTRDPEYKSLHSEQEGLDKELQDTLSTIKNSRNYDAKIYEDFAVVADNALMRSQFITEQTLKLIGMDGVLEDAYDDEGNLELNDVYEGLSALERRRFETVESKLEKSLTSLHSKLPKVTEIKQRIEQNSTQYLNEQKSSEYKGNVESLSENLKGVGVLDEQALELEDKTYGRFIHDLSSDPANKAKLDAAVDALAQFKYGAKPVSEQVYEYYDNLPSSQRKSRAEVDKMLQQKHQNRTANMDKEIATFIAHKDEIYKAINGFMDAQEKKKSQAKKRKSVASAESMPTRQAGDLKQSEGKDHLAELLGL